MSRDHLRCIIDNSGRQDSAPAPVHRMEIFTFAQFAGGMIVLHNDQRISAPDAMVAIWKLLEPSLRVDPRTAHVLEGKQPLFPQNHHESGNPIDGPKPICAETEGDMA